MTNPSVAIRLTQEIREIAAAGTPDPETEIERHVENTLRVFDLPERLKHLENMAQQLGMKADPGTCDPDTESGDIHRLVSRFLGKSSDTGDISSRELAEKFADSLDTLFDSLNQIVSVINVTLLGESPELETIRKVIGSNIKGETGYVSTKEYLERIQKAFLVAHKSFQLAAATMIEELLAELDPEVLSNSKTSALKFGPLRKAELFEQYEQKHARCKRWFSSGDYKERLLREFEKQCQLHFNSAVR